MYVYKSDSRYSSLVNLKYKQYYTIYFLVCVSILFIVPEFWVGVQGITQKIIILDGGGILCVCKFVERVSAPRLSGIFSPRFYSETLEGYKLPFVFYSESFS